MSTGSIIGGVVGGVVGWFAGGPMGALYGAQLGFGVGMAIDPIRPDMPVAGRVQTKEITMTTAEEGVSIAEILGSPKMTGNIIGYWNSRSEEVKEEVEGGKGGGGSQSVTTGYKYYLSWLMGICIGPVDTLYAIYENDKLIWEGELDCPASGGRYDVVIPDFGTVTFYFGTDDQEINFTMRSLAENPTLVPAYRHLCCAFFDDCFIGELNRLPVMRFVVKKVPAYDFSTNDRKQIESYDYNGSHAVYHFLNKLIGLDESFFNEDSFDLASQALYCENIGLTMLIDKQMDAINYIEQILYHIGGILRFEYTGKFSLILVRRNVLVDRLPTIDETMMLDDLTFGRDSWISTFNDIKIQHPLRYYATEVNGEAIEGDGQGDCSMAPSLNYIGCIDESYYFYSQAGKYTITSGCGPFALYYKDENMSAFKIVRDTYGREFTYLCRSIVCAGDGEDRQIKVYDKGSGFWSNTLDINVTEAPVFGLTGGGSYDVYDGETVNVTVAGGKPSYYWTLTGNDVFFDSEFTKQSIETISTTVTIYAKEYADLSNKSGGSAILNVSDGCISLDVGTVNILTCCSEQQYGPFEFDDDSTPDNITAGSSIILYTDGGCGPYTFSTSSLGYTFTGGGQEVEQDSGNITLYCASGTVDVDYEGVACIKVTDECGTEIKFTIVNNDPGEWATCSSGSNDHTTICDIADLQWSLSGTLYASQEAAAVAAAAALETLKTSYPDYETAGTFVSGGTGEVVDWGACIDDSIYSVYIARVYGGDCEVDHYWRGVLHAFRKLSTCD